MATGDRINVGAMVYPNTAIPYWGTVANLTRGWQICDGTNGTPDLRSQFIRGASSDSQVGATRSDSTARPNTSFYTSNDSHNHTTNPSSFSIVTSSAGSHSHSGSTSSAYATTSSSRYVPASTNTWYGNTGDDISSSGRQYAYVNGDSGAMYSTNLYHSHAYTTSTTGAHIHTASVDVPSTTSSTDTHYHNITGGGDSETAPQHILMYWITYTGELAPNW